MAEIEKRVEALEQKAQIDSEILFCEKVENPNQVAAYKIKKRSDNIKYLVSMTGKVLTAISTFIGVLVNVVQIFI